VKGVSCGTIILVDPGVRGVGIDPDVLVTALHGLTTGRTTLVPGLASHPELLTRAAKTSGARKAVVVVEELEHPTLAELRTWGAAGGLATLGVQVVALDILRSGRSTTERSRYAVRMVRAALASADGPDQAATARRPAGASLSRRALLSCRATTWVPVVEVDDQACLGTLRCDRCIESCPDDALQIRQDVFSAAPVVDASRCGACSRCLEACPTNALSLDGHDPETLAQRLRALLQQGDGAPNPALILACQRAVEPLHRLGSRGGLPGWLVLEVSCLGGLGSAWHLAAIAAGARTLQILPCASCRDRASLTRELRFTRALLDSLGDGNAARRVGVLPDEGRPLRRAILTAGALTAAGDGTGLDRMPALASRSSARVAAWAVGELRLALGGPAPVRVTQPRVIEGEGAPLGVVRAAPGCTACGVCARSCPTRALSLRPGQGGTDLVLDPAACTGCGLCAKACPEGVLDVLQGIDHDLLARGRVPIARAAQSCCLDCGVSLHALPVGARLSSLPAELASRCPRCRQIALVASI